MERRNIKLKNLDELKLIKKLFISRIGKSEHTDLLLKWDALSSWSNQKEIRTLFFNKEEEPMYQLLRIALLHLGSITTDSSGEEEKPLYYFIDMYYSTYRIYETIQYLRKHLDYCMSEREVKEMLIFCRFLPDTPFNTPSFLAGCLFVGKKAIYNYLVACKKEIFAEHGITDYPFKLYEEALTNYK